MLYTSRPLERIYAPPEVFDQSRRRKSTARESDAEYKEVMLKNGRIITRREGDNYIIERINSTDMSDYLKAEYTPGRNYIDKAEK
ncbi:MAG: hypothetical protein GX757_07490 [Clostridiales bacterium]|nr:hypothetical protein [Clostridiales bacterium]